MLSILSALPFFYTAVATPQLNFAFNSQLPPVARWGESYTYTISEDTFVSDDGSEISYSAANLPSWLTLNDRTLSGTLENGTGVSSATFQLTAIDSTGNTTTDCVLQLTDTPAPTYSASALEAVLASSGPVANADSAVLTPNKPFSIQFPNNFFGSDGRSVVGHYAVTSGHSPLPIWLEFDGSSGLFSGTAPAVNSEIAKAQTFSVLYIVSTYSGFESAAAEFSLLLGANVLSMNVSSDPVNATVGQLFSYDVPLSEITLNGESIQKANLSASYASIPSNASSWLSFDNSSYVLSGTPPSSAAGYNYTVTIDVVDSYQDAVSWDVLVEVAAQNNETVFSTSSLPSANATRGGWFQYSLSSYVLNKDATLELDESTPDWLSLNNDNFTISGLVPGNFTSGTVSIVATDLSKRSVEDDASVSAHFEIYGSGIILSSSSSSSALSSATSTLSGSSATLVTSTSLTSPLTTTVESTGTRSASITSSERTITSSTATASSSAASAIVPISKKSSNGVAIGCGVGIPVGLVAIAAVLLVFFCRRRRRNNKKSLEGGDDGKGNGRESTYISEPTPTGHGLAVTPVFRRSTGDESSLYDDALEYPDDRDDGTICTSDQKTKEEGVVDYGDNGEHDESPQRASTINFMAMDNNSQGTLSPASDTEMPPIPEQHDEDEAPNRPRESWRYTNTDDRRWQDNRLSNSSLASVVPPEMSSVQLASSEFHALPRESSSGNIQALSRSSSQYTALHSKSGSRASEQSSDHDLTDDSGYNFKQYIDEEGRVTWRKAENGGSATLNTVNLDRRPSQVNTPEGDKGEFVFV